MTAEPFLANQIFAVNDFSQTKISYRVMSGLGTSENTPEMVPVVEVDNVFSDFSRVRTLVDQTPPCNWKHKEGSRNFIDYYDCRIRYPIISQLDLFERTQELVKEYFEVDTKVHGALDVNWFKQIKDKEADFAYPHSDDINRIGLITCIIYGNYKHECSGGTGLFWCLNKNHQLIEDGSRYWPLNHEDVWDMRSVVEMEENKMMIFPSVHDHAAYHPINSWKEFPRLTFVFRLQVIDGIWSPNE